MDLLRKNSRKHFQMIAQQLIACGRKSAINRLIDCYQVRCVTLYNWKTLAVKYM